MALRFQGFAGMAPRIDRRFLKDNQAQEATNCRVTSGAIDALREPGVKFDPGVGELMSIFRMVGANGAEKWLAWGRDVDVQRGSVAGDLLQRIYWTGDGEPRTSTYADVFSGAGPYPGGVGSIQYVLGTFAPSTAPTVGATGGSGPNVTLSFVYTFVSARGEESQPSPAGTFTAPANATSWDISGMDAAPANTYAISAASWAGGLLTVTVGSTRGLRGGETLTHTDLAPGAINGAFPVAAVLSPTQYTIAMVDPGAITDAVGTATRGAPHNFGAGAFKRIYATVTSAAGAAEFRLWADNVGVATATHSAAYSAVAIASATLLPSIDWAMPPSGMRGLYSMPNGIMVGFVGNEVCFSEAYLPHTWPVKYRQSVPSTIVGIGGFGTTLVIGTTAMPHTITGVEPVTMGGGASRIEQSWPCLSKRGMASSNFGVIYPTTLGLVAIGPGGADIVTRSLYTEEEWRVLNPSSFVAATIDALYAAGFTGADGVTRQAILFNRAEFSDLLKANLSVDEFWADNTNGRLYCARNGLIAQWDDPDAPKMAFDWWSKEVLLAPPTNFAAAKIDADFVTTPDQLAAAIAANAALALVNQALIDTDLYEGAYGLLPIGEIEIGGELLTEPFAVFYESLQFQIYANNMLKFAKTVTNSRSFKLPSGYKNDATSIRIAGNVRVRGVVLGTSVADLRQA